METKLKQYKDNPNGEFDMTACKICKQSKKRIRDGSFDPINKRYVDDTGAIWNGLTCGDCHRQRIKDNMQKLRDKRKANASKIPIDSD